MVIRLIDGAEWACTRDGRPITIIQRGERMQVAAYGRPIWS